MSERRDSARHGTRRMYELGCRCFPCRLEASNYTAELRAGKPRRVPIEVVADHVEGLLDAGMLRTEIQEAAGLGNSAVWHITSRKGKTVNSRTAEAILALEPPSDLRSHLRVLTRSGWTAEQLADETGLYVDTVKYAIKGDTRPDRRTKDLLFAVEPLERSGVVYLPFEPLRRHLELRMKARGQSVKSLGDANARAWHRYVANDRITEAAADRWATRYGLLIGEVYGWDYDNQDAA